MGFADDIKKFRDKALKAASDNTNKVVEDLYRTNVYMSPEPPSKGGYSIGTLKNNWYAAIGDADMSYSGLADVNGVNSIARIVSTLSQKPFYGKDNVVYITNSTPWAVRADRIGWPKNDPTNNTGWSWTGRIGPYLFTSTAMQTIINKYST